MSVHKEISFESEICQHLVTNGWLYAEGDAAATTVPAPCSLPMCWPGCRRRSPKPGRR